MRKILPLLFLLFFLQPLFAQYNSSQSDIKQSIETEIPVFLTRIEYYQYFIGKPVPSHFRPTEPGDNIFAPENQPVILGQEAMWLGVKNGIVETVMVYNVFDDFEKWDKWIDSYHVESQKLGYASLHHKKQILFSKDNYIIVYTPGETDDRLTSGEFQFWDDILSSSLRGEKSIFNQN